MTGIVLRVHDEPPPVEAKPILNILDDESILSPQLLELAQWIAQYYIAPVGEVLRAMVPLMSEVRKQVLYRITDLGREALFEGAEQGSSRRSRRSPEEQDTEYKVLNYLENGDAVRVATLRSATGVAHHLLTGMLRKKWIIRETRPHHAMLAVQSAMRCWLKTRGCRSSTTTSRLSSPSSLALEASCLSLNCAGSRSCLYPGNAGQARAGQDRRPSRRLPSHAALHAAPSSTHS